MSFYFFEQQHAFLISQSILKFFFCILINLIITIEFLTINLLFTLFKCFDEKNTNRPTFWGKITLYHSTSSFTLRSYN